MRQRARRTDPQNSDQSSSATAIAVLPAATRAAGRDDAGALRIGVTAAALAGAGAPRDPLPMLNRPTKVPIRTASSARLRDAAVEIGERIGGFRQVVKRHAAVAQFAEAVTDGDGGIGQFVAGIVAGNKAAIGRHAQLADGFGELVRVFGNGRGVDKRVAVMAQPESLALGDELQQHGGRDDKRERTDKARFQR